MDVRTTDGVVIVDRITSHATPPPLYPAGRVCIHPGCRTVLSVYNSGPACALHEPLHEATVMRVHRPPHSRGHASAA